MTWRCPTPRVDAPRGPVGARTPLALVREDKTADVIAAGGAIDTTPTVDRATSAGSVGELEYYPDHDGRGLTRFRYMSASDHQVRIFVLPTELCDAHVAALLWELIDYLEASARQRAENSRSATQPPVVARARGLRQTIVTPNDE